MKLSANHQAEADAYRAHIAKAREHALTTPIEGYQPMTIEQRVSNEAQGVHLQAQPVTVVSNIADMRSHLEDVHRASRAARCGAE